MDLTLAEELFLIALDDKKGSPAGSAADTLQYGLVGALLAELAILNKLSLDPKKRLVVVDRTLPENPLLSYAFTQLLKSSKPRKTSAWIEALGNKRTYRLVASALVDKKILRQEEKRFLWVIPYAAYPQEDASAKYWIKIRLRSIALASTIPGPRDLVMLGMVNACRLTNLVFTRDERKTARKRIAAMVKNEMFSEAVAETIEIDRDGSCSGSRCGNRRWILSKANRHIFLNTQKHEMAVCSK